MENPLSGLISGTIKRPVIINGALLMDGNSMVVAKREAYKVVFTKVLVGRQEVIIDNGDDLMTELAENFNKKYANIMPETDSPANLFTASVDSFTGAIVIKNNVYEFLVDRDNVQHLHDSSHQFQPEVQKAIRTFVSENTVNYFNLYVRLMNRRFLASHMPPYIKGHLVAGLYQPFVVATKFIDCPLRFGEFDWFTTYLNSPEVMEEFLEQKYDSARGLELTAVAMCDLCSKFQLPLVKELPMLHWMFMLYTVLMTLTFEEGGMAMAKAFPQLWDTLGTRRRGNAATYDFFEQFSKRAESLRNAIVVR